MAHKLLNIKNAQNPTGSLTFAIPIGRPVVVLTKVDADWRTELSSRGVKFTGKGPSVVLALQDLVSNIMKAAIKQERKGRTPDRVRLAASLFNGEPN